jgi:hypothetical protein
VNNYWKNGLSVNETRFSILGFLLIVGFIYTLIAYHINHEITSNLLDLVKTILFAFVGVNAIDRVSQAYENRNQGGTEYELQDEVSDKD